MTNPRRWALFVDIDGTLLNLAPTPDAVRVPASLVPLLEDLGRGLGWALGVLTGRRMADADRMLAPLKLAGSGVHGTEVRERRAGPIAILAEPIPSDLVQAMNEISQMAEGILVEQKGAGIAVHYRNAPLAQKAIESEVARIVAHSSYDLVLRRGRKVLEAVPMGFSKGRALTKLAQLSPFQGLRPIMIGDDVGDESAFLAAEQLGGIGLKVAGEHFSRSTADFDGVAAVRAWLEDLAERLALTKGTAAV